MDTHHILTKELIDISQPVFDNKEALFVYMADKFLKARVINNKDQFVIDLLERESEGSTYVGDGIAIPHAKSETVNHPAVSFCRCMPFEYVSNNESGLVSLVMMLAIPKDSNSNDYIKILSNFSRLLLNERFFETLVQSKYEEEIMEVYEEEKLNLPPFK